MQMNDITKNYNKIIGQINKAIDRAVTLDIYVILTLEEFLSEKEA